MRRQLVGLLMCVALMGIHRMSEAALLSVDVNDRGSSPAFTPSATLAGFSAYQMTGTSAASSVAETQAVGAYSVSLLAVDDGLDENVTTAGIQNTVGAIDDRLRTTPANAGSLTYSALYTDFIFAGSSTGPTGGMNLTVSGGSLLPNTQYVVSIYAFDSGSTPVPQPRTANWLDGNNGDALVLATSFSGAGLPTTDDQYKFTGLAQTDGSGILFLKGRNTTPLPATGGIQPGVFINGFEIDVVPEPVSMATVIIAAALVGLTHRRRSSQY